jgi:RNA polymerase sigma factor (sigma-70 family)
MTQPRPDRSNLNDDELVRLIRGGETEAFTEVVRRTRRPAYRLARRITGTHEDADDVVQDSFVKAYQALDRFQLGKALSPWILTIVARTALSSLRQEKRRRASSLDEPVRDGSEPLSERIPDPSVDPAELDRLLDVEQAFERLSEEHRVILALRVEADLSYAAMAEALSIPLGTVMSRLARAREALGEELNHARKGAPLEP